MQLQTYYENPSVLHIGTEENRAYYIPFTNDGKKTRTLLNGSWEFQYYTNSYEVDEDFFLPGFDSSFFTSIPVPSCWQMEGFDNHHYTDVKYPFPYDPPYVPSENPCGAYRRTFSLTQEQCCRKTCLNFEGVDSCFYLWINGTFAGYSQVSHSTSEFDITDLVKPGENLMAVLVLKWCDGSYLEDQDKFRMSGIFRDVYLLHRPSGQNQAYIRDYSVHTSLNSGFTHATVEVSLCWSNADLPKTGTAFLYSTDNTLIMEQKITADTLTFDLDNPVLWNAEVPKLYTLDLKTSEETIRQRIGIRSVTIEDNVLKLNGTPIKFKGVNRHDSDPVTGFTISREQALTDLRLMKEHNINAIRTSHYPNAPWFLDLCDEYGFYVIGEVDLESHGCTDIYGGSDYDTFGLIVCDPAFENAILDRVQRCVVRDRNHASVLIWSLGNESGYGKSLEKAGRWAKGYDPSRPLHYEGSIYLSKGQEADTSMLDLYSRMYPSISAIEAYLDEMNNSSIPFTFSDRRKPFVICEFVHSMGNGPGDIEEYYEKIYSHPCMCGGFAWEWCDHAIDMGRNISTPSPDIHKPNLQKKYLYGGDFKEFPHEGNFCVDGLVYPDRRPHTGLKEYKNVIRPIRITLEKTEEEFFVFCVRNTADFSSTADMADIQYAYSCDGCLQQAHDLEIPEVLPHQHALIRLPKPPMNGKTWHVKFTYMQKSEGLLTKKGHCLGFDQILLSQTAKAEEPGEWLTCKTGISLSEDMRFLILSNENFTYVFDKYQGTFSQMTVHGKNLMEHPIEFNLWRAPTDNDMYQKSEWKAAGYDRTTVKVYSTETQNQEDGSVVINCRLGIHAVHIQKILDICAEWHVRQDGRLFVSLAGKKNPDMPYLPRFGLRLFLSSDFKQAEYTGYGPYESYIDKHRASWYGHFSSTVSSLHEDYIRPQENGSHWGCTCVSLCSPINGTMTVTSMNKPFSFNASPYTQEQLEQKPHNFELKPCGFTVLCLDYKMSGIGSNSCGPKLMEPYRFNEESFCFQFAVSFEAN